MSATISEICAGYLKIYPGEKPKLEKLLRQINKNGEKTIKSRKEFDEGHVTAAGFVLSNDRKNILMIDHRGTGQRFQPGGHIEEEDENLLQASLREVHEETGITASQMELIQPDSNNKLIPIDIDTHYIPDSSQKGEPEHYHYDFRYLFIAKSSAVITANLNDIDGAYWVPWEEFADDKYFSFQAKKIDEMIR